MLSSSVQGVTVQQKAPLHRRSHGEGPRHCQPHQLSDRAGHGCTWWKQRTPKRPGDGEDRRHGVMLQPLHIGDVASWHRVRRHPHAVGRRLVSTAVHEQRRLQGRIVGDDLTLRWRLHLSTFPSDLCIDRITEAIAVSDKLYCHKIVRVSENLHVHLLGCLEVSPQLWPAIKWLFYNLAILLK